MTIILDQEIMIIKELLGESFYDERLPESFRKAQKFAGKKGFVATLPDLVHGRIVAPAENEIWKNWHTPNSEEIVGTTTQGNKVFIVDHDIVILTPNRIERAYKEGLTPQYAAKLTDKEVKTLLSGKTKPVFSFDELKKQTVLPRSYTVVIDFDVAKKTISDHQDADKLPENPVFVARAGTVEQATDYVKKAKSVYNTNKLGNWHPLNNIDPTQAQGRVPYLSNSGYSGFYGDYCISDSGRPVGVAPETHATRTKKEVTPKLEQILKKTQKFVPETTRKHYHHNEDFLP